LAANLPADEFKKLTETRAPSKIHSILDLIEQAKKGGADT